MRYSKYIEIEQNTLVILFPEEPSSEDVDFASLIEEAIEIMLNKKLNRALLRLNNQMPKLTNTEILTLVNKTFHSLPFRIKIALFYKDYTKSIYTTFIEKMNSFKGNLCLFFADDDKAKSWLKKDCELKVPFLHY